MNRSEPQRGRNSPARPLSESEAEILAFEKLRWKYAGAKDSAILERFGMSPTRYYQVLNALIDRPEAQAAEPLLVGRLRRLRDARAAQRTPGRQSSA